MSTSANTWELGPISSAPDFLAAVAQFIPCAHTASFEIRGACSLARQVYAQHRSAMKYRPIRDTIAPRTHLYYCKVTKTLSAALARVLHEHETAKVFWHIKGFGDRKMIFSFHDADSDGSVCFSPDVDAKTVRAIGAALNCKPRKIETRNIWQEDYSRS